MLVVDRADQLFEQVLQRDQARDAPILIKNDGEVCPLGRSSSSRSEGVLGLRDEERRPNQVAGEIAAGVLASVIRANRSLA